MLFNFCQWRKYYFNKYFLPWLIKIFSQRLQKPISYLQASPESSQMLTQPGTGNQRWVEKTDEKSHVNQPQYHSAAFICPLWVGFIATGAHPGWIKTTIQLHTKTNSSHRNADKTGNYEDFCSLSACTSP